MKTRMTLLLAATLTIAVGCEVPDIDVPVSSTTTTEQDQVEEPKEEVKEGYLADGRLDMSGIKGEPAPVTSSPREFVAKDAKKGKLSRQAGGSLGALGNARFYAEHEMVINSYTHALNLFWGMEGRYPKTHEEFMEKIIKANNLKLPELEAGDEYIYDPEDHKLKIWRPEQ